MKSEQKRRAIQMINAIKTRGSTVSLDAVAALLQELIDAEDRWKSKVKEAIGHAEPNERSVMVDGLAVFFSRADDSITDTHTLEPCPHCGGSGAAEDCKQAAGGPDGWQAELLDWVSACQSAYHVDSTPGHRFGGLGSNLEENRAALIDYVEGLLSAAPEAPAVQHSDDIAVDRFATAMKAKMAESRSKGRYGWDDENVCESEYLRMLLQQAVNKGDPVDVGNFAMMLFCRGESAAPLSLADQSEHHLEMVRDAERYRWLRDSVGEHWDVAIRALVGVGAPAEVDAAIDAAIAAEKGGA